VTAVTGVCVKEKETEIEAKSGLKRDSDRATAAAEDTKVVSRSSITLGFALGAKARTIDKARLPLENRGFSPSEEESPWQHY
jgi:hypothetical protein